MARAQWAHGASTSTPEFDAKRLPEQGLHRRDDHGRFTETWIAVAHADGFLGFGTGPTKPVSCERAAKVLPDSEWRLEQSVGRRMWIVYQGSDEVGAGNTRHRAAVLARDLWAAQVGVPA